MFIGVLMFDYISIPKSESDMLLNKLGCDLMEEYFALIKAAKFPINNYILDVATGTGRAASILSRLGYRVITGDYNYDFKFESEKRITEEYLSKVKYIRLNLEKIPFPDNAVENIVCIDTLHELDNPLICLNEILRIHSPKGKLLIADFNSKGFDVMDKLHMVRYGRLHPRGKINSYEIKCILANMYYDINEIDTKLNIGFIASGKKIERDYSALELEKTLPLFIEIPLTVNTYDIDVAGHVNNIVYIRWLEELRSLLFSQIYSLEKLLQINYYLVVAVSEIKYRKQIKLFDKPVGKMILNS